MKKFVVFAVIRQIECIYISIIWHPTSIHMISQKRLPSSSAIYAEKNWNRNDCIRWVLNAISMFSMFVDVKIHSFTFVCRTRINRFELIRLVYVDNDLRTFEMLKCLRIVCRLISLIVTNLNRTLKKIKFIHSSDSYWETSPEFRKWIKVRNFYPKIERKLNRISLFY